MVARSIGAGAPSKGGTSDSPPRRRGASDRARQNVQPSRGGPLVDRQRRQQQHRRSFGSPEHPVAAALIVEGVRVVLTVAADADRYALMAYRRLERDLLLPPADAEI